MKSPRRRIFIAEDHPTLLQGIIETINREDDLVVCGNADDAPDAIAAILQLLPDLALIDVQLKSTSGLDVIRHVSAAKPGLRMICMTLFDACDLPRKSREVGAYAVFSKQEGAERLLELIRVALSGGMNSPYPQHPPSRHSPQ